MPRQVVTLESLAPAIEEETGVDRQVIFKVMRSVCKQIGIALNRRAQVSMYHLGTFKVREDEFGRPTIVFSTTSEMTKHVRVRPEMNKYGVILDKNASMTAKLTGKCPVCGADLESKDPPKCPQHGTQPFEERPHGSEKADQGSGSEET